MVEIMRAPSLGGSYTNSMDVGGMTSRFSETKLASIDETEAVSASTQEARKEQGKEFKKTNYRAPRRAFSTNDYQLASPLSSHAGSAVSSPAMRPHEPNSYFSLVPTNSSNTPLSSIPGTPAESPLSPSANVAASTIQSRLASAALHAHLPRPELPGPQRSYSVMDYVPVPVLQRPGEKLRLVHLPAELHFAIFDFLDDMDSACLGLASRHFYYIHRRMRGTVPLSTRRAGPNDMEWIWRLAGPLIANGESEENAVNRVLPRGQVYCRKCGVSRCELHKHIQEWMGNGYEYCEELPEAPAPVRKTYKAATHRPIGLGHHEAHQQTTEQRVKSNHDDEGMECRI
ncbi:hypothetical protein PFICI_13134 [Pestalotiopsis fici W106-1]|uniref:F-box domain-containing protein n=1 Tax=Pestalotiopsis fici (strain W106-1 / CGMCC3.15140) TaxID=1229662 RepID=W3WL59_PESFW|nr:uncharacterized protein PFICI_13134 [Pestalotiopsis fici W106-1]ETS74650.1 hypothetical protein PFICI_13134 [Pestalotiopsis fici W106-1]